MRGQDLFLLPATVLVAIGGTLWGGHNTYVALQNRSPIEISCADYLRQRPDGQWLHLTHCFPDFDHMAVESSTRTTGTAQSENGQGKITTATTATAVYVPLRGVRGSAEALTQILLSSDDADMLTLGSSIAPTGANPSVNTTPSIAMMTLHSTIDDKIVHELSTSVEGLVESGLTLSHRRRTELGRLNLGLGDDFIIVDRGARPQPLWFAVGELLLGTGVLALLVRRFRRWSPSPAAPLPRATLARRPALADADEMP